MLLVFTVPELTVLMLPVEAVRVVNTAVIALSTLVAKLPVTVRLLAVVLPSVEEPTVKILPNAAIPETVVDPILSAVKAPF